MIFLSIILPFAVISIYFDIKTRKIRNWINLSFLYVSILVLSFFSTQMDLIGYLTLIIAISLGYYLYSIDLWAGADGKIFIALSILVIILGSKSLFLDFMLNLALFYTIGIVILILFKTKIKHKFVVLKNINYGLHIFLLLIIFLIIKDFIYKYISTNSNYNTLFIFATYFLLIYITPKIVKFYSKMNKYLSLSINLILFVLLYYFSSSKIFYYFFIILGFRIFLEFVSNMTILLRTKDKKQYYSPFSLYLFFAAVFTMVIQNNIVLIILKFLL